MTGSSEMAGQPANSGSKAYRAGVAVAALTAFLSIWTSIVRDDGNAMGFFMTILAVGVGCSPPGSRRPAWRGRCSARRSCKWRSASSSPPRR